MARLNHESALFDVLEALKPRYPQIAFGFARGTGGVDLPYILSELAKPSAEAGGAGMKPWAGGDSAPADWDGGPVLLRDGNPGNPGRGPIWWLHATDNDRDEPLLDIIAYTPALSTPTAPDEGEEARAREVLRLHGLSRNDKHTEDQTIAAMLVFRPSEGEGLREAVLTMWADNTLWGDAASPTRIAGAFSKLAAIARGER